MTALLLLVLAASPPAPAGCADHWIVQLNAESFAHNGAGKKFSAPQLAMFRDRVDAKLKAVVGAACRNGAVPATNARTVKHVTVASASGATEPHFYESPEDVLTLEWVFAEENLGIPPAKDILDGTGCWIKPEGAACSMEGD